MHSNRGSVSSHLRASFILGYRRGRTDDSSIATIVARRAWTFVPYRVIPRFGHRQSTCPRVDSPFSSVSPYARTRRPAARCDRLPPRRTNGRRCSHIGDQHIGGQHIGGRGTLLIDRRYCWSGGGRSCPSHSDSSATQDAGSLLRATWTCRSVRTCADLVEGERLRAQSPCGHRRRGGRPQNASANGG